MYRPSIPLFIVESLRMRYLAKWNLAYGKPMAKNYWNMVRLLCKIEYFVR